MKLLSQPFEKTRVLVALALLLSAGAPLVQYACGVTGETLTASTLSAEPPGPSEAPCGVLSDGVHDRLCGHSSIPGCEGDVCTTDTVKKQWVVYAETSSLRIVSALTAGAPPAKHGVTSSPIASSRSAPGADWNARNSNRIPVRLRTLSLRL